MGSNAVCAELIAFASISNPSAFLLLLSISLKQAYSSIIVSVTMPIERRTEDPRPFQGIILIDPRIYNIIYSRETFSLEIELGYDLVEF